MANTDLYKDRSPSIIPAGISNYDPNNSVANCLEYISLQEQVEATLSTLPKTPEKEYPVIAPSADIYCGYYTQVSKLISPPKESLFHSLESELQQTAYKSYWTRELGSLPDQIPGLPFGMDPGETKFGKPTPRGDTVQELVNPKITSGEVNLISELGHELYRKTHNSYFPGEQKSYNYPNLPSPKENIYGIRTIGGPQGTFMPEILGSMDVRDFVVGPQNLALYKQRYTRKLGKSLETIDYTSLLPKGMGFGEKKVSLEQNLTVEDCLRCCDINEEKIILKKAISYVCGLRRYIRNLYPPFSFVDFAGAFRNADSEKCDCLPVDKFYNICMEEGLHLDRDLIDPLLRKTAILHGRNNLINYHGFTNLLDTVYPFPDIGKIEDLPKECVQLETSYAATYLKDLNKKEETAKIRPAGLPIGSLRYQYNYLKNQGMIKANLEDFPTSTTVENCISPGLFPSMGVSHRDFFQPRTKEYIRDIFERIDVKFTDEIFEKLWVEAVRRDGERVCIETFRNLLDEVTAVTLQRGAEF